MTLLSTWELWASAQHYISEHGEDAPIIAAMRCDELLNAGDFEGVQNFHAIIRRINQLLEPVAGALH